MGPESRVVRNRGGAKKRGNPHAPRIRGTTSARLSYDRLVRVLVLVVLAACSIDSLDLTGKACPCPSGYWCETATQTCARDMPVDAACATDRDGDSVADCTDNCPDVANREQYDEDGDNRGDACDVCPGDVDDGADTDGDKVGDACDPNPTQPTEHLVLFEGFHEGVPSGWRDQGIWRQVGDDISAESGDGLVNALTLVDPLPNGVVHLIGKMTIGQSFDPAGSTNYVGLIDNFNPATDASVRCVVGLFPQSAFAIRDTGGASLVVDTPYPFAAGMTERFVFTRDGNAFSCKNGSAMVMGTSAVKSAMQHIGIRTRSTSATYAWMMIVETTD